MRQNRNLLLPGQWEQLKAIENAKTFVLPLGVNWIERDVHDITNEIMQRWPELRVASCSCGRCLSAGHYPHMVMEITKNGSMIPVFGFMDFDRRVINHLMRIDAQRYSGGVKDIREQVQSANQKIRDHMASQVAEDKAEKLSMVKSALMSHKHDYSTPIGKCNPTLTESSVFSRRRKRVK